MLATAIVRQRGQLTIPDRVRRSTHWLREGEVVGIEVEEEKIVLKPHFKADQNSFDWKKMWQKIQLTRSFEGKEGNLSKFVVEDRKSH